MDFPIDGYVLDNARNDDVQYILSCVKEDILLSVTDEEKRLSSTWIDDTLALARFSFAKRPMLDEFFVLKKDDEKIGMLWLGVSRDQFTMDDVGYVLGIFVSPEHRRKGLGRTLMQCAETWTKDKNLITLALNVGERNSVAVQFYESLGYNVQTKVLRKNLK